MKSPVSLTVILATLAAGVALLQSQEPVTPPGLVVYPEGWNHEPTANVGKAPSQHPVVVESATSASGKCFVIRYPHGGDSLDQTSEDVLTGMEIAGDLSVSHRGRLSRGAFATYRKGPDEHLVLTVPAQHGEAWYLVVIDTPWERSGLSKPSNALTVKGLPVSSLQHEVLDFIANGPGANRPATTAGSAPDALPSAPPPAAATTNPAANAIANKYNAAIVIVSGSDSEGSGFLCRFKGKPALVTNIHVLAGAATPTFKTIGGEEIKTGAIHLAVGADIAVLDLVAEPSFSLLEIGEGADAPQMGREICVLGNSGGAGAMTSLGGVVKGLGPAIVEVTAEFVPGNSGSPIVDLKSEKVLAVASYLRVKEVVTSGSTSVVEEVRRFGYRLDTITKWEPYQPARFRAEATQLADVSALTEQLFVLLKEDRIVPARYTDPRLKRVLDDFVHRVRPQMSLQDREIVLRRLVTDLRSVAKQDVNAVSQMRLYDFFRRELTTETQVRDKFYALFDRWVKEFVRAD